MANEQKGWKNYGVYLPATVKAIIDAAGGADPKHGGMPYAMASIIGALPHIAVALHGEMSPQDYAEFAQQVKANLQQVWQIVGANDPKAAFDEAYEAAKKVVN